VRRPLSLVTRGGANCFGFGKINGFPRSLGFPKIRVSIPSWHPMLCLEAPVLSDFSVPVIDAMKRNTGEHENTLCVGFKKQVFLKMTNPAGFGGFIGFSVFRGFLI